ncbi:hypothetical protein [Methyloceanibacter sp.]
MRTCRRGSRRCQAARNPRFRHLLGGVWFYSVSPEVTEKLEKARGGERW